MNNNKNIFFSIFLFMSCFNTKIEMNENYMTYHSGNLPIFLIVSHDGSRMIKNIPVRSDSTNSLNIKNDLYTMEIANNIYSKFNTSKNKPYILINDVHRKYVDMNRSSEHAYEADITQKIYNNFHTKIDNTVNQIIENYGKVYIYDIHGFSRDSLDLVLSTRKHSTITEESLNHLIQSKDSFANKISDEGFIVSINEPFYGGHIIKSIYDTFGNKHASAVQVEIGRNIRFDDIKRKSFENIFYNYLNFVGNDENI